MGVSLANQTITVHPFSFRVDGDEAIIVNSTETSFLAIPVPALELLQDLAAGQSIEAAQARFTARTGESPDLDAFLDLLVGEGFVSTDGTPRPGFATSPAGSPRSTSPGRYHFENISETTARRILSWPTFVGSGLLIAAAALAIARDPALIPPPTVMVFTTQLTLLSLAVFAFITGTIFLHELAHLIAARAAGSPARLAISHRLWYLVAETDLSGVWLASRRQRYLAFLAGPLVDLTLAAVFVLVLGTDHHAAWLPPLAVVLLRAFLFTVLVRLLWQGYFFVRTDLYYVIATFFGCKNLMEDTENWLRNQIARIGKRPPPVDQSFIPAAERRVIRGYAVVWLVGRAIAFGSLAAITLPILWNYLFELVQLFVGAGASTGSRVDGAVWIGLTLAVEGTGLFLWLRGLFRSHALGLRLVRALTALLAIQRRRSSS